MTRYAAVYVADATPRFKTATLFSFSDPGGNTSTIGVLPRTVQDALGTPFPSGAAIELEITADDLDGATMITFAAADLVVVLMNLTTPGWTTLPSPEIVYAIDGPIPRPAYLFAPGWTPGPRTFRLDEPLFEQLLHLILNLPDESMWRASHAANNFRIALQDPDAALRVPRTYSGLEFLNPLLTANYGGSYSGKGQAKGVGGFIEGREGSAFEERARLARNDIVHGTKPIPDLASDLAQIDLPTLKALRDAVIEQLGATGSSWTPPNVNSPSFRGRLTVRFDCELTPNTAGEVGPPGARHPGMSVRWSLNSSRIDSKGNYHGQATPHFTFDLADGASLRITGVSTDTAGSGVGITVTDPVVTRAPASSEPNP